MSVHQDFEDLLRCLNTVKAKYLIVGAHAVAVYSEPRYTKDLDIWVEATRENALKVYEALKEFGAPIKNLKVEDLTNKELFYQIGVAPIRIDIIMGLKGVDFSEAWKNKKTTKFGKEHIYVLGLDDLVKTKKTAARPRDKEDLRKILKAKKLRKK